MAHASRIGGGKENQESTKRTSLSHKKRTRRLLTLIVALVVAYIACWTPFHIFHFLVKFNVNFGGRVCIYMQHVYTT